MRTDKQGKTTVSPHDGGCWFCFQDAGKMVFDVEFDTYLHKECLIKALEDKSNPSHEEAEIMSYLLSDK